MPVPTVTKVSGLVLAGAAAEGIAGDHIVFVGILAAVVVAVIGTVAWIDARIQHAIEKHTETDVERHDAILGEIRHLRELMQARHGQ